MEFERLKKIIEFNRSHSDETAQNVRKLYRLAEMEYDSDFLNVMQVVRPLFQKKAYIIVEIPFKDKEIGALCYNGDALGYLFLNSSLPKVNVNFALCHEIYHVFFSEKPFVHQIELYMNEHYHNYTEELAANSFAGTLLMPEQSFRSMCKKFLSESDSDGSRITPVVKLMSYFEVPFMAALIRCYELGLLETGTVMQELLSTTPEQIESEFARLWLDESILKATRRDDYSKLELFVKNLGAKYVERKLLNERTVQYALNNMKKIYQEIRE